MSTEILTLLNAILELSPIAMAFLTAFASVVVAGMALFLVLVMKKK